MQLSEETVHAMMLLWNSLKADERKALADLMAIRHADYLCTAIKKAKRCHGARKL